MVSSRIEWLQRISELVRECTKHEAVYFERIGNFGVYVHPTVFSPKYHPETLWYAENLPAIVQGRSFLEIGVGSGLVSLYLAASGSTVLGVDVNPYAIEITEKNFETNGQVGKFLVSDIFENISGKFDFIFWNHPWQNSADVPEELKSEKTLDEDYGMLKRYISQAKDYLSEDGSILLGTSHNADLDSIEAIISINGYTHKIVRQGQRSMGKGITEEYYIIQIR